MPRTVSPAPALRRRLALAVLVPALSAWYTLGARAAGPDAPPAPACEVREVCDVAYYRGKDADPVRHRLDLFLPRDRRDFPVVLLVHGGTWMIGDKSSAGLYSGVGRFLARQGIGAALPNYRLSPWVQHPEHVKDVARAFAWVHDHIADYGGRPDRLFVAGHSAGGHLAALLATDDTYLKAQGLRAGDIRGVIPVCGVYYIPPGDVKVSLGGTGADALNLDQMLPLPDMPKMPWKMPAMKGLPLRFDLFGVAFGDDPAVRADASPLNHVRPGLPPFLVFTADKDLPTLPRQAEDFVKALQQEQCDARLVRVKGSNHNTIMFEATTPDDPVAKELLQFIREHAD